MSTINITADNITFESDLLKVSIATMKAQISLYEIRISNLTSGGDESRETEIRVHENNIHIEKTKSLLTKELLKLARLEGNLYVRDDPPEGTVFEMVGWYMDEVLYIETDQEIIDKELEKYRNERIR